MSPLFAQPNELAGASSGRAADERALHANEKLFSAGARQWERNLLTNNAHFGRYGRARV